MKLKKLLLMALGAQAGMAAYAQNAVAHFDMSLRNGNIVESVANKAYTVVSELPACTSAGLDCEALRFDGYSNYVRAAVPVSSLSTEALTMNVCLAAESYPMMQVDVAEATPTYATICGNLDETNKKGFALQLSSQGDLRLQVAVAYGNGYLIVVDGNKKLGGTVSEKFLNEDSGKLEAGETHSIDGSFDANHNILSIKGMYNEEAFQYNSNKQISKMTMGTYSYDFTWENGNMVRCTSSGGSALIFLYGDEDNTFPANANLVMGLVVESEPLAIFGHCGPATKKLPVGYIQDFVSSSIEYAITYEKDNSGRIVKMTSKMAQGDEYAHVRVLEIKY